MSGFALLHHGGTATPRVVKLSVADDRLFLAGANDFAEEIPWWRLYRSGNEGSVHRFRRLDRSKWELRVTAGADQALLAHVKQRSLGRFLGPLHRLHILKAVAFLVTAIVALSSALPANWVADAIPSVAEHRLVDGYIASRARHRCARPGGEAALRTLLTRLDPELGPKVDIVAINDGGLMVTSFPAGKLLLTRDTLTALEADALSGLLAHELAHLRRGDPIVAAVRHEGNIGIFLALLGGPDRESVLLRFSGEEEERADRDAVAMMRRAQLPILPAAAMFETMRIAGAEHSGFAAEQRDFHFGIADRARYWQNAADRSPHGLAPLLTSDEADALYNFCWAGPLPVSPQSTRQAQPERGHSQSATDAR